VTIITTQHDNHTHGMTANAFVSVSLDPPLILIALDNRAYMNQLLPDTHRFGVSVLAEDQQQLSNHFAGRTVEGLHIRFITLYDMALLEGAVAYFVAHVVAAHPAGDHTLYVGHVDYFDWRDDKPLLFYSGTYQQLRVETLKSAQWPEDDFSLFSIGSFDPPIT
jgi:flavin reductase (DIM6/NTAB) family NADH-FMN oxidoreductase RutF